MRNVLPVLVAASTLQGQVLWAPKGETKYIAPHRPHTKLADLKAKHGGQNSWRELIVDDEHLRSEYIFAPPGHKHPRALHPDSRAWWVVMDGEIRFDIEGVEPFTARKGSMVQVPMQTLFSYEVAGDVPALFFETNIAKARTLYVNQADAPKLPQIGWVPVNLRGRQPGNWLHNNQPHVTFEEVAKALEGGELKGTQRIVQDDRGAANFIYGYEKNLPPFSSRARGHYHPEGAEYWLILAGQIRYPIEGVGDIIANVGDVVYVPKHTFHAPRWHGPGPSCRLAMNGFPFIAHLFDPD
jgi:mannose-6-phosphate isomerase-like protein (cupin superfamily)